MRTFLRAVAIGILLTFAPVVQTGQTQVHIGVHIHIAPPVPVPEVVVVRPDPDAVWIGGYHEYDPGSERYIWRPGHWDHPPRRGMVWEAPRYRHDQDEYKFKPGRWKEKHEHGHEHHGKDKD